MRILLSNDDGYFAPGLERLAAALAPHAEITVVAPERDRSGASNSLTLDRPLTVRRAPSGFLFVNGTPTDCVHLAVTGLLDRLPDIVISGINLGANMGDDTIYSGTVAAATEGYLLGIPSIAISLASKTASISRPPRRWRWNCCSGTERSRRARGCSTSTCPTCRAPRSRATASRGSGAGTRRRTSIARSPRGETVYWVGAAGRGGGRGRGHRLRRGGAGFRVGDAAADRPHQSRPDAAGRGLVRPRDLPGAQGERDGDDSAKECPASA